MFKKINIEINEYKNKFSKIRLDEDWKIIIVNKEILFEEISKKIFKAENVYFYLTAKNSAKTWDEIKSISLELKSKGIVLQNSIFEIFENIGWLSNEELNINSRQTIGDLGEYIMHIFVDFLGISKTLISKITFKTSKNVSVFGVDGIFFDYENKILYSAESKFWSNLESALKNAIKKFNSYDSIQTLNFVRCQTLNIKDDNENIRKKKIEFFESIENVHEEKISFNQIFFIMEEDCYLKNDIRKKIEKLINENFLDEKIISSSIFVFFPIISKKEFLFFLKNKLEKIKNG